MRPAVATPPMTGGGLCARLMPGWSGWMWESQANGVRVLQRSMSTRAESSASVEELKAERCDLDLEPAGLAIELQAGRLHGTVILQLAQAPCQGWWPS